MSGADLERKQRANDLYWRSDKSVNQIAEELDLSKGTLYELIRPQPAGVACPDCAEELVYPNRTAKERAMVACSRCGWEGNETEADYQGGDGGVSVPEIPSEVPPGPAPQDRDRNRVLVGGALLGAAAGLALVLWSRRR